MALAKKVADNEQYVNLMEIIKIRFPLVQAQQNTQPTAEEELSISILLKNKRMEKNIDIITAAQSLRIRRDYLMAIEEGDINGLPERVYTLGFVRAYARYLDFNIDATLQRFKQEILGDSKKPHYTLPKPINENTKPQPWLVYTSVIIGLTILGAWFIKDYFTTHITSLSIPQSVQNKFNELNNSDIKVASSQNEASQYNQKATDNLSVFPSHELEISKTHVSEKLNENQVENQDDTLHELNHLNESQNSFKNLTEQSNEAVNAPAFSITGTTWIHITDAMGHSIQKKLFHKGDSFPSYPFDVILKIGNAHGICKVEKDQCQPLGRLGEVVSHYYIKAQK